MIASRNPPRLVPRHPSRSRRGRSPEWAKRERRSLAWIGLAITLTAAAAHGADDGVDQMSLVPAHSIFVDQSAEAITFTQAGVLALMAAPEPHYRPSFQTWNPDTRQPIRITRANPEGAYANHIIPTAGFAPNSGSVAVDVDMGPDKRESVNVWDPQTGRRTHRFLLEKGVLTTVPILSTDGRFLCVRCEKAIDQAGDVRVRDRVYDLDTGSHKDVYTFDCNTSVGERFPMFSQSSRVLACMSPQKIVLISLPSMSVMSTIATKPSSTYDETPDRKCLILGPHKNGRELVYDVQPGDQVVNSNYIRQVSYSAAKIVGSKVVLLTVDDKNHLILRLWDMHYGEADGVWKLEVPKGFHAVDFFELSPSTNYIAGMSVGIAAQLYVWQLSRG